jgi:hypothetical protein
MLPVMNLQSKLISNLKSDIDFKKAKESKNLRF